MVVTWFSLVEGPTSYSCISTAHYVCMLKGDEPVSRRTDSEFRLRDTVYESYLCSFDLDSVWSSGCHSRRWITRATRRTVAIDQRYREHGGRALSRHAARHMACLQIVILFHVRALWHGESARRAFANWFTCRKTDEPIAASLGFPSESYFSMRLTLSTIHKTRDLRLYYL